MEYALTLSIVEGLGLCMFVVLRNFIQVPAEACLFQVLHISVAFFIFFRQINTNQTTTPTFFQGSKERLSVQ